MTDAPAGGMTEGDRAGAFWRIAEVLGNRLRLILGVLIGNLRFTSALRGDWRARYGRQARTDLAGRPRCSSPRANGRSSRLFYRLTLRARGLENFKSTFGRFLSAYEPEIVVFTRPSIISTAASWPGATFRACSTQLEEPANQGRLLRPLSRQTLEPRPAPIHRRAVPR